MTTSIEFFAPAKINLFLHVIGQRADGYHELQTVFQLLDWGDTINITPRTDAIINVQGVHGITPQHNLAWRAARLLQQQYQVSCGADIRIDKRIPLGSGLGGGSSNAAIVLCGLNALWGLNLSRTTLATIALPLGADIPFFIHAHSAFASGIGEQLFPLTLSRLWFLLIIPRLFCSTAEIFRDLELTIAEQKKTIPMLSRGVDTTTLLTYDYRNDLTSVAERRFPLLAHCRQWLDTHILTALHKTRMSGSGSSLFLAFPNRQEAIAASIKCPQRINGVYCDCLVVAGINRIKEGKCTNKN